MPQYDLQGRPVSENPNPPSSAVRYDDTGKRVYVGGKERGTNQNTWFQNLAFGSLPGEDEFYQSQIARGARTLGMQAQGQRSALFDNLESRGIGRSSIVGDQLASMASGQNQALANIIGDVQSQQFAARQQRINAYLNYLYSKKLQKKDQSWLGNLFQAAKAGANLYANRNSNSGDVTITNPQPDFNPGDFTPPTPPGPNP